MSLAAANTETDGTGDVDADVDADAEADADGEGDEGETTRGRRSVRCQASFLLAMARGACRRHLIFLYPCSCFTDEEGRDQHQRAARIPSVVRVRDSEW